MLTGNLCLIAIFVGVSYIAFDVLFDRTEYLHTYWIMIAGAAVALVLLRARYYTAGRLIALLSNLVILTLYAYLEPANAGLYMFFLVLVVASLTIFGHDRILLGVGSALVILLLFLFLFFGRFDQLQPALADVDYYNYSFGINFLISLLLITLMIHYLIKINHHTLENVRKTEKDLLQLTDELTSSRNRFKLALKGSSSGIWDWDAENNQLYISPLLNDILGYSLEQSIHATPSQFFDAIHPDDLDMVRSKLDEHFQKREKFEVEFRILHGSGKYIWILDTGQAEWDKEGNPVRMVGSIIDITERKENEKQIREQNLMLEKTNAELDRFVYSVSHDLKSPLSSILGLMSIAEMSADKEEIMQCLVMMRERVDTLNGFIEEIIDYSRNTRTETVYDQVNLYRLVEKCVDGLKYMANMKEIRIEMQIDPEFVMLTDPGRLKIVLNNLIGNAVKYHSLRQQDPYILVALTEEDDALRIIVKDNGQGIPAEIQKRVFDMFYRGHESSRGSGLGLYIAREMIHKLDGEIHLLSEMNAGSQFTIILPKKIRPGA